MITTEDELFEDVRYWKARADAAETEMCEARVLGGKYLNEIVAQKKRADEMAKALEEIAELGDVRADEAGMIARRALAVVGGPRE